MAANNQDIEKITDIKDALERMKAADEGFADPLEADIDFHLAILAASGNVFYMQLRSFTEAALRVSIRYTNHLKGVRSASYSAHKKIYDAIESGNAQAAIETSRELQLEALELITHKLEETKGN
ncbi:MAG: hypothetical protein DRQ35_02725 [Gammaproteobacteria bacterium]|nr:MAG: hypothetical protein DRQ35_02725 [Gammaproteobacteria bacterium]RLA45354.1 MAG: hypothetical protein DRR42_19440 [Gammaproteobacteria bacterium]